MTGSNDEGSGGNRPIDCVTQSPAVEQQCITYVGERRQTTTLQRVEADAVNGTSRGGAIRAERFV